MARGVCLPVSMLSLGLPSIAAPSQLYPAWRTKSTSASVRDRSRSPSPHPQTNVPGTSRHGRLSRNTRRSVTCATRVVAPRCRSPSRSLKRRPRRASRRRHWRVVSSQRHPGVGPAPVRSSGGDDVPRLSAAGGAREAVWRPARTADSVLYANFVSSVDGVVALDAEHPIPAQRSAATARPTDWSWACCAPAQRRC
jgi:hypothetical protein